MQAFEPGRAGRAHILDDAARVCGERDLQLVGARPRQQVSVHSLAVRIGRVSRQLNHTDAERLDVANALPRLVGAEVETLQCAIAPLPDRLERLADAEDAEALALQIVEQSKQLGRLVVALVRWVLAG